MAVRILWSHEEALILLDALLQVQDGKMDRKTAIESVSKELRERAINNGIEIDDVFRNTNGITFQMSSMEYMLTDGEAGMNKRVSVFEEVVSLYKNDINSYQKQLREIKGMQQNKTIEELFSEWLSKKVPQSKAKAYLSAIPEIDTFCLRRRILKRPLFQTTDSAVIKEVIHNVYSNKVFRFSVKKDFNTICIAIRFYSDFIKENPNLEVITPEVPKPQKEPVALPPEKTLPKAAAEMIAAALAVTNPSELIVDFRNLADMVYTKPISVIYFDAEPAEVNNWSQAYVKIVGCLLDDYPDVFAKLINTNITSGQRRADFSDRRMANMVAPKMVTENFYVECNYSTTDIINKIRTLLELCNIDYENLIIKYEKKVATSAKLDSNVKPIQKTAESSLKPSTKKTNSSIEQENFAAWMKKSGSVPTTISGYISAIGLCMNALKEYKIADVDLFSEKDSHKLIRYRDTLLIKLKSQKDESYRINRLRAAMNKLIDYRSDKTQIKLPEIPTAAYTQNTALPKIAMPNWSKMASSGKMDQESKNIDHILRERFSEGMQLNALRLDKFRMIYEDAFHSELPTDDTILVSKLKRVGSFMDNRVYPKQDKAQNNLIVSILTEVINTLNDGARCVYFSCVMERWKQELSSQMNVYNVDTLKALIKSQNVPGLVLDDNALKATIQKVYPEENVVELLRESHDGMNYQQIQDVIWYIPLEMIKYALMYTPSIVNIDAETYFYAPNFPASPAELQQLKNCMVAEISQNGYLVAKDIARIIQNECPTIAMNIAGYTDWGCRNILSYLFRDDFQFTNALVSAKGKKFELWEVYSQYCRSHSLVTMDELKQLANELGVVIYWDAVLDELIRINENELVKKEFVHFDISKTDKVLEEMCPGDYIPIQSIGLFLHFPPVEYPWNIFVLESYLRVSKKFQLYHMSYANQYVYGFVVRRSSKLKDYRSVVVDLLAHDDQWTTAPQALAMIVQKGCQARKKWNGFEQVAQEAALLREKLQAERK